ncbi:hypothetical protein [Streptomyces sp. WM6372]|uniref:hypothetical protein n=1 Tax=Streptomyces sp. WM6372 TaxID=1415555 RepID=UPI000ADD1556|nr:hypothetical protein [Streptomyces sp. WM6372]
MSTPDTADNPICKTAKRYLDAGYLNLAQATYITVPATADTTDCALHGLRDVATARQNAANLVTDGQQKIREGKTSEAKTRFNEALIIDAENAAAATGLVKAVEQDHQAIPTASSNWDRFYSDWLIPIGKLVLFIAIGLTVLLSASGILSGWVVGVRAVVWSKGERHLASFVGLALITATSVMLPLYAMFKPFDSTMRILCWMAGPVLVGLVVLVLIMWGRHRDIWRVWSHLLCSLGAIVMVAIALSFTALTALEARLGVLYVTLGLFGVLMTAAALGQNLRLQVEAQLPDGTVHAASTDYLLARMQTLGTESPNSLHAASPLAPSPLSRLTSEHLSALPAGATASSLSRVFFTLRPDLTWRARATIVDDNRVSISLSRNGRHAKSIIFSRLDLGLPPIPVGSEELQNTMAKDLARAQLLTGAAAFILLHLSQVHPDLKQELCGARNWKSVTLQVIATSASLIHEGRRALLARAVNEDPGYALARFDYLREVCDTSEEDRDYRHLAEMTDRQITDTAEDVKNLTGWKPLHVRALYRSAVLWVSEYVQTQYQDTAALSKAQDSTQALIKAIKPSDEDKDQLSDLIERIRPFVDNLQHCISVLAPGPMPESAHWFHPHGEVFPAPALAYDNACLDCFLLETRHEGQRVDEAIEDLRFALVTEADSQTARTERSFQPLQGDRRFRQLVGTVPPTSLLELPVFATCRASLHSAGLTTSYELVRRTNTETQRSNLAAYLEVSPILVDQIRDQALLAQLHPDLDTPGMLHLFIAAGVNSPDALREAARRDVGGLVRAVKAKAAEDGLTNLNGVREPWRWLVAGGGLTKPQALAIRIRRFGSAVIRRSTGNL